MIDWIINLVFVIGIFIIRNIHGDISVYPSIDILFIGVCSLSIIVGFLVYTIYYIYDVIERTNKK